MKLTAGDQIALLDLLPQRADSVTLRKVQGIVDKINAAPPVEVPLNGDEMDFIQGLLRGLDEGSHLDANKLELCEVFLYANNGG